MPDDANTPKTQTHEFMLLKRWAAVALAVRCVQRIIPIAGVKARLSFGGDASAIAEWAVVSHAARAVQLAANSARAGFPSSPDFLPEPEIPPIAYPGATSGASANTQFRRGVRALIADVGVMSLLDAIAGGVEYSILTIHHAATYFGGIAPSTSFAFNQLLWSDYDRLRAIADEEGWTDESPVDPDWLGPLWPQGIPPGCSTQFTTSEPLPAMQFEFIIPASLGAAARAEFRSRVANLYAELSAAHVMMGGTGLRILDEAGAKPLVSLDEAPHDCSPTGITTPEAVLS